MAASIYPKQSAIELVFNTQSNLLEAHEIVLHAKSPLGVDKTFTPTVLDGLNGIVKYNPSITDFEDSGLWTFYISVVYNNTTVNRSEPTKIMFN